MSMSKKDYKAMAELLREFKPTEDGYGVAYFVCVDAFWNNLVGCMADLYAKDNENFNRDRFYEAAGYDAKPDEEV